MSQTYRPISDAPEIHVVPRMVLTTSPGQVDVDLDGSDERRWRFAFQTRQGVRIRTSDCVIRPEGVGYVFQRLAEVTDSVWLDELRTDLETQDPRATFMGQAHHYLIDAGDDVIEVVAWSVSWDLVPT